MAALSKRDLAVLVPFPARRSTTLEATNNGKTRSRRLDAASDSSGRRERSVRHFRDIHGTESACGPAAVVLVNGRGDGGGYTTRNDDVLGRHRIVVRANCGGHQTREGIR